MQQFSTLKKYKNVFFVPYDSQFRFEVFELLLRLWSGQAKRNRVFEIRKPGRCFIQKKKGESERGRVEKKPYSCVWLKNKTAALSEPLKSPSPVIVSRHLQLEAAGMFVVVLKASECGFHMVYFYFFYFFSWFFFFPTQSLKFLCIALYPDPAYSAPAWTVCERTECTHCSPEIQACLIQTKSVNACLGNSWF